MDQSNRYANLALREEDLIADGRHVLCAYIMKPKSGYGYLETAAHFAAESSTGTNVEVSTTDDFTRGVDALVYEIDPDKILLWGDGSGGIMAWSAATLDEFEEWAMPQFQGPGLLQRVQSQTVRRQGIDSGRGGLWLGSGQLVRHRFPGLGQHMPQRSREKQQEQQR